MTIKVSLFRGNLCGFSIEGALTAGWYTKICSQDSRVTLNNHLTQVKQTHCRQCGVSDLMWFNAYKPKTQCFRIIPCMICQCLLLLTMLL